MSNYPAKFLPFYLVVALIFLFIPGFCAQSELTEMEKQAIAHRQKGWQLQQEGNIEEALSYYQKATLLDPNYVMAYNDIGVIYEAMGYPEQAKQMYLKAIKIDLNYPDSYSNLALLYEEEKDYKNAILYWIKRATFGGVRDSWAEVARKHLENIARVCPEAYYEIGGQYRENLHRLDLSNIPTEGLGLLRVEKPKEINLFSKDTSPLSKKQDNKVRALQYLTLAKQSFALGQYVAALKEATVAEYFDSSNAEITAFVYTVRKKILR